jgi:ABC-2 type transport system ATP-binding protein
VMDEAGECDSLLLMREGSLLAQATPQDLRLRTGEEDLGRAFLAMIRSAEGTR